VVRIGIYCRRFRGLRGFGREAGPCGGLEWIDLCDSCAERDRKARTEVERLEALWRARECAASDCRVVFVPARVGQRFHDDRCRKRTHRRLKAQLLRG